MCTGRHEQPVVFSLSSQKHSVAVNFESITSGRTVLSLIEVMDWLCKSIRMPRSDDALLLSTSSCYVSRCTESAENGRRDDRENPLRPKFGLHLQFSLASNPLPTMKYDCWQPLFKSCFAVEHKTPHQDDKPLGRGLELSFDMMMAITAVEYPMIVHGGLVFVGYHTVVIPTKIHANYVQFHLDTNATEQINPYNLSYGQRALCGIEMIENFKTVRCFIGWRDAAHILLGTTELRTPVKFSNGQRRRRTLHMNGISAGFQALSAGPAQVGLTGSANFVFVSHKLSFLPTSIYSKMLRNASKQVAIVNDLGTRRSWLVPRISLLLHMAHASVREHTPEHLLDTLIDPIPFCDPHYDGSSVVEALDGQGDVVVWGEGQDSFRLRTLLLGLNINLLKAMEITEASSGNSLFGFEFMDIVTEPGRGAEMREMSVMKSGRNWLHLSKLVDTIVFCAGLGEAIAPVERRPVTCNSLPIGHDYLAAPMSCLSHLTKRCGGDLSLPIQSCHVMLSQDRCWTIAGDPFKKCRHDEKSKTTCWEHKDILQNVRKATNGQNLQPTHRPRLPSAGVVVFGQKIVRVSELFEMLL